MSPGAPPLPGRRPSLLIGALLLCLALGLYLPTLSHGFVNDDFTYISENPAVLQGAPAAAYFLDRGTTATDESLRPQVYRPLRTLAFRAVALTLGVRPASYRIVNVLLYGAAALWLYGLCLRLTRDRYAAAWAAALWIAAPVHVEAVVYASALGDQLSLLLSLLSLSAGRSCLRAPGRRAALLGAASVALGDASLLCKEMAITTVALLAVLIAAIDGPAALRGRRAVVLLAAHASCAAGFLLLRTAVVHQVGQAPLTGAWLRYGLLSAPVTVWRYVRLCLLPLGHSPAYAVPPPSWPVVLLSLAALLAVFLLAAIDQGGLRGAPPPSLGKAERASRRPALQAGAAWFVVGLLPVLNLVPVLTTLADRLVLLSSLGLFLCGAAALCALPPRLRGLGSAVCAALLLLLAAGTLVESRPWQSDRALWHHAVEEEPDSEQAHNNLGVVLLQDGQPKEALRELDRARELGRDEPLLDLRRGLALLALDRLPEAAAAVEAALRRDSGLGRAHAVLGEIRLKQGRLPEAEQALARARALTPDHAWVPLLAGELARRQGHLEEALRIYAALAARAPGEGHFHYLHARAALEAGDAITAARAAHACLDRAGEAPGEARSAPPSEGGGASAEPPLIDPRCGCVLGRALLRTSPAEAHQVLDRALALWPEADGSRGDDDREACLAARRALSP